MERTNNWMRSLADHYRRVHSEQPNARLLLIFDIDGTILDTRQMVVRVLLAYDAEHGTDWFRSLKPGDVKTHESNIEPLLREVALSREQREQVLAWYGVHRIGFQDVLEAYRPFRGVLEVIRWFQMQPNTDVALVTSRQESRREATLHLLNTLGERYRVRFDNDHLFMRPDDSDDVIATKLAGLEHFRGAGYQVVAVVDNESANLQAIADNDAYRHILLLHAEMLFSQAPSESPAIRGTDYDLEEFVAEAGVVPRMQFCWANAGEHANMAYFLSSEVSWGELIVRREPDHGVLVVSQSTTLLEEQMSDHLLLDQALRLFRRHDRKAKLMLTEDGLLADVLATVRKHTIAEKDLWFTGPLDVLGQVQMHEIRTAHPDAARGLQGDFLAPLVLGLPAEAERLAMTLREWGVTCLSLGWDVRGQRQVIDQLCRWGFDVDIERVGTLDAFLEATIAMPSAVTSGFFPKWESFSGQVPRPTDVSPGK